MLVYSPKNTNLIIPNLNKVVKKQSASWGLPIEQGICICVQVMKNLFIIIWKQRNKEMLLVKQE